MSAITGRSQDRDTPTNFDSIFNSFKGSITSEFQKFQNKNDSVFLEFLQKAWKEYQIFKDTSRIKIKFKIQPHVQTSLQQDTVKIMKSIEKYDGSGYEPQNEPIPEKTSYSIKSSSTSFEFYGVQNELPEVPDIHLNDPIDNFNIINFYRNYLKNPAFPGLATKLKVIANNLRLNDFGYFLLTQKASRRLFRNVNDQVLFTWVSLLRSGMQVKVGYNKNDIILLMDCDIPLYNMNYINVDGVNYYLIRFPDQEQHIKSLQTYTVDYPGKVSPVTLKIKEIPLLSDKPVKHSYVFYKDTIRVDINLYLIDYLGNYPACELSLYFNTPFSEKALVSLDRRLRPLLNGKSETEKVNILIKVHTGIISI